MNDTYYAKLEWQDGIPLASKFGDYYFSKASGIAETNYVFLEHNNLAQRFKECAANTHFTIGETGFGSGRNFLATLQLWREQQPFTSSSLHYLTIEKHPLTPQDLAQILARFPEFESLKDELIAQYYLPLPGFHRLSFAGNVKLTLIIADIQDGLSELTQPVDAWFLDGFSPAKNQAMWNKEVCTQLARLSHQQTTFATYSASSAIRQSLTEAGFTVTKDHGYGAKREMIYGSVDPALSIAHNCKYTKIKPYFAFPQQIKSAQQNSVAIIGAGISGAATAYSLAKRGYQVSVFEKNHAPALEASGNYQGMLYGTWSAFGGEMMELSCAGYRYSHYLATQLLEKDSEYEPCGLVQLAHNSAQLKRQQQLLAANFPQDFFRHLTQHDIEQIAAISLAGNHEGLFFPYGLWLNPHSLVKKLLTHPNIRLISDCEIATLAQHELGWDVVNRDNLSQGLFTQVVLCNAHAVNCFVQTKELKLRKIRGQISIAAAPSNLKTVLCGEGYITPPRNGKFTIGATFQFQDQDPTVRKNDHRENLANFSEIIPNTINQLSIDELDGQTNFRASSYDYFPLVGPIAQHESFMQDYAKLSQDKNARIKTECTYYPGLYLNVAHGSKGMLTAPLCGEIIADYICATPLSCSEKLRQALHPNRCYVRDLVYHRS